MYGIGGVNVRKGHKQHHDPYGRFHLLPPVLRCGWTADSARKKAGDQLRPFLTTCCPLAYFAETTFTVAVDPGHFSPLSGSMRPPRHWPRNASARALKSMLFSGRAKPWPSSEYTTYVTEPLFFSIASTICSDSAWFTRGSFAPCPISSGFLIAFALNSGDAFFTSSASFGSSTLPMRASNIARIGFQYGGIPPISVFRLHGAPMTTPPAYRSGVTATRASVAYPPYEPPMIATFFGSA